MLDEYLAKNNQALTELIEVHGVELRKLPDDVIEEFTLEPNDMIYIPKGWRHCPTITGPRCSVSFSIEDNLFDSVEERSDI